MCARYTLRTPASLLAKIFDLAWEDGFILAGSDIRPSTSVCVVRCVEQHREFASLKWSLLPVYAKTEKDKPQPFNATAEKLATSGMFRNAFRRRRCLIPADGWYEWKDIGPDEKERYLFRVPSQPCFAFAGIWERWKSKDQSQIVESCAIVTTEANDLVASIHEKKRMPVILRPEEYQLWLDHEIEDSTSLLSLLRPFPDTEMEAIQVPREISADWFDPRCWPHLAT